MCRRKAEKAQVHPNMSLVPNVHCQRVLEVRDHSQPTERHLKAKLNFNSVTKVFFKLHTYVKG